MVIFHEVGEESEILERIFSDESNRVLRQEVEERDMMWLVIKSGETCGCVGRG